MSDLAEPDPKPAPTPTPTPTPTPPPAGRTRSRWAKAGAVGGAGGAFALTKSAVIVKALAVLKGLAVLAKFKVAASMVISVGAYALFWGWRFAVGFVLLLLVHELGHVVVLRAQGVEASAPMFIPFVGAFVAVKGPMRSVTQEATSALAGPAIGAAGSYACLQLAYVADSLLLQALAYTGFLINLFNMLPMLPLDGGRVAGALHPAIWAIGTAGAIAILLFYPHPILFFVLLIGGLETWKRWRDRRAGRSGSYYRVPTRTRAAVGLSYVAVAAFCLWGMNIAFVPNPG